MSPTAAPRRTRFGGLLRYTWRASSRVGRPFGRALAPVAKPVSRPLAALTAPVRIPLAIATAPLGRPTAQVGGPLVSLRHGGLDVTPAELAELAAREGTASGRLLVLVPDVGADERQWQQGSATTGATYAERLQQLLGWTPVHTRLEEGRASETGAGSGLELASLLQRLVDAWPVPVCRIALLAAGRGGLTVRAACAMRLSGAAPWTDGVSEVIGLGVPRYATEPSRLASDLGKRLDEQLAGIVVLDADELGLEPAVDADHLLIGEQAVLGPGPVGSTLGRMLWWRHRRGGRPRHVVDLFPTAESFELAARGPMTNRDDVHDALLRWLV
ncbi:hypothetical protein [Nocardioides sp. Iso805N]|uniref:hypothetical protein n=1 Tax=Nocardioides sp. Iso805N TaxID=1283287 RepID=UPI0003A5139D|nr:hypothetical protein [Nocardioides sp. Iso805N]